MSGRPARVNGDGLRADSLRIMLFTDTLADVNGVSRFIVNMGDAAAAAGRALVLATSTRLRAPERAHIWNFAPLFARAMPGYGELEVAAPPVRAMLRAAREFAPDVVHISTPGPVGAVGLLAARILKRPVAGVYHTDFPAYVEHLFAEATYTSLSRAYMQWFYRRFALVFSRSEEYMASLESLGMNRARLARLTPGIALDAFGPDRRDPGYWRGVGVREESTKALYVGRVSVEKNLPLLVQAWPRLRERARAAGRDVELIVVGDGPYRAEMERLLRAQGALFLGFRHGEELATIYASADLFVFPSLTDTLGQVVIESQASGLPVLVSDQGGPREVVVHGATGFVLPGEDAAAWTDALARLLMDDALRTQMGRRALEHSRRYSIGATFEDFWARHAVVAGANAAAGR